MNISTVANVTSTSTRAMEPGGCRTCIARQGALFCNLPANVLDAIDAVRRSFSYPPGTFLFFENEANRGVHVVCSGQVKLSVGSRAGRRLILHIAQPGEALGLLSALTGKPYETTAEVLRPTTISFIRQEDLLRLSREHPEVNAALIRQLTEQFDSVCDQLRTIGLSTTAPQKLARLILKWSKAGRETQEGVRITVPLTHEQIAECMGSSRETVTRTLTEFRNRHLIVLKGATMLIPSTAALEAMGGA